MEGIFAEPASAAVIAGIETARDQGVVDAGEGVVAVITGNGLKDTSTAYQSL
jgi:threonine synthase